MTSISNAKPSISIEIPSILMENLVFQSKYPHLEFEIPGISIKIPSSKCRVFRKLGISTK